MTDWIQLVVRLAADNGAELAIVVSGVVGAIVTVAVALSALCRVLAKTLESLADMLSPVLPPTWDDGPARALRRLADGCDWIARFLKPATVRGKG